MPGILSPKRYHRWLDPKVEQPKQLPPLFQPYPADRMEAHPVNFGVNDVRNDRPELIELIAV